MSNAYVFDLDDTLVASEMRFDKAVFAILDEEGIPHDAKLRQAVTPLGFTQLAHFYREQLGVKDSVAHIVERMEQKMRTLYTDVIRPKPGVPAFLQALHDRGDRLFVLTATVHSLTDVCLRNNGLYDLFEQVWAVDDFGLNKSDVELFERVASVIGCSPAKIRYFEDNPIALENARRAGWQTFAVYNQNTETEIADMKKRFTAFVYSFENFEPK